ncbi:hypothetical protein [Ammoniphilus sp. CFH 90114]|uniref:hypothetical protein n=1 Tax=Ammoniphilus sp. CFH 90114 TaxID=2493665 RepID=UPI00100E4717|nr:hypothetical protein [Ammoniphilus sp. CFH 90114]RXT15255.1 hypothetical protein EIZ39_03320 [Ammoniphilus sp. CFH 90114]
MTRYVGQFRMSKSDNLLYYYEDGPYKDVLAHLKELTQSEPKYIRSARAWTVPLPKLSKKLFVEQLAEKEWSFEML